MVLSSVSRLGRLRGPKTRTGLWRQHTPRSRERQTRPLFRYGGSVAMPESRTEDMSESHNPACGTYGNESLCIVYRVALQEVRSTKSLAEI